MKKTKKTFTKHFGIKQQEPIEFINIPLDEDLLAFICPFLIANNRDDSFVNEIYEQLESFLKKLNRSFIMKNDKSNGLLFLSHLHEPNEYHLGYSSSNKGKAMAKEKSETVFDSLNNNQFAKQGLSITNEAHNVLLLVEGIGQDIMSDIISNVCRNVFGKFTEEQCAKHSIKTYPTPVEYYDVATEKWSMRKYNLPEYKGQGIILIPKKIVSNSRAYSSLYNWFMSSNYIAVELMKRKNSIDNKMIVKLKDGTRKAIIKEINRVYKKPKNELIDFVLRYNGSLEQFLAYAKKHYPALNLNNIRE